jgi:AcrR family transcriptional regulator
VRILDSARSCFVTHGYDQTTMKNIATEAGITAGALYHHFTSKQDLFAAAYHRHQVEAFEAFDVVGETAGTFVEHMAGILDVAAYLHENDRQLAAFTAVATIELQRHPELRVLVGDAARTVHRFFDRLLSAYPDEVDESDHDAVVNMLVAMFTGLSVFAAGTRRSTTHRAAIEAFKRTLAGTLLAGSRPAGA